MSPLYFREHPRKRLFFIFVNLAATRRTYWPGIRRFIELRITNGPVEGYNSKIRMISHRAFGFHSGGALIAMIRHPLPVMFRTVVGVFVIDDGIPVCAVSR